MSSSNSNYSKNSKKNFLKEKKNLVNKSEILPKNQKSQKKPDSQKNSKNLENFLNEQMMSKSLEPGKLHKNIEQLKRNKEESGTGERQFNVPIRLSHTENIDFSGTGGSNNANSRQKRKEILSSLLDSGIYIIYIYIFFLFILLYK